MRIVHHEQDIVLLCHFIQLWQGSDIAVHAEHAVGDDQGPAVVGGVLFDRILQRRWIIMLISDDLRTREPAAVDNGGMVQAVREDHILFPDQGGDRPQVGRETRLEGDHILCALEFGKPLLELDMQVHGAGDRAHRSRTDAVFPRRFLCRLDNLRVVGQPEIVIRAEVEHILAIHRQPGALGRADRADAVVQALFLQAIDFLIEPVKFGHGDSVSRE